MVAPVAEEQSWEEIARTVALAMVRHLPDATSLQAEYHLVMQHLTGLLWRLGAAHLALRALGAVYRDTAAALRPYVVETGPYPHSHPARHHGAQRVGSNPVQRDQ
jgi:hypothetical protein